MKKIISILILTIFCSITAIGQDVNIKFKANEKASVTLGRKWDFSYETLNSKINVEFNGKTLHMFYDSGKEYWKTNVISYERKESKEYGELKEEFFILKIKEKGYIKYIIIEKDYDTLYEDILYQIQIPYVSKTGQILSYTYYQYFN